MIRIAISAEAFAAIIRTMPVGSVGYENEGDAEDRRVIWLDWAVVARLRYLRGGDQPSAASRRMKGQP